MALTFKDIDNKQLKAAIKDLNDAADGELIKALGIEKIRVVAVSIENLFNTFVGAIDKLWDKIEDEEKEHGEGNSPFQKEWEAKIPESCITLYNSIADDEPPSEEERAAKEKKKKAPKKEVARSCYGHLMSAMSGQMDAIIAEGCTYGDLEEKFGTSRSRIKSHLKALANKGLTVSQGDIPDGKDWKAIKITVKEKALA